MAIQPLVDKFIEESGSSETPISLFFYENEKPLKLTSFLKREKSLSPNILSIPSIKSVSKAMVLVILSFVVNLMNLECRNHNVKIIFCCMDFFSAS